MARMPSGPAKVLWVPLVALGLSVGCLFSACARHHDGKINLVVYYQDGQRVRSEEDTDFDGRMDTWEYYGSDANGTPVVMRVERDTKGAGKPDTFETYAQQSGSTVIVTLYGAGRDPCTRAVTLPVVSENSITWPRRA